MILHVYLLRTSHLHLREFLNIITECSNTTNSLQTDMSRTLPLTESFLHTKRQPEGQNSQHYCRLRSLFATSPLI